MTSKSVELWRSFVEAFASMHDGVERKWVVERDAYPDTPKNRDVNQFLSILSPAQKQTLSQMLVEARRGGIFDALVVLHDRIAINKGRYSEHGVEMAFEPYGYKLYEDCEARRAGQDWPLSGDA